MPAAARSNSSTKRKAVEDDTAFDWGDEDELMQVSASDEDPASEEENELESAPEKRIRLAKEYLEKLNDDTNQEEGSDEEDTDIITGCTPRGITGGDKIAHQLSNDVKEAKGKLFRPVALELLDFEFDQDSYRQYRGHKLSTTATTLSNDGKMAFSVSKDGTLLKWDLTTGSKTLVKQKKSPKSEQQRCLLAVALSADGKYLATGGKDQAVRIWDPVSTDLLETFTGHRDSISCLAFRKNGTSLYSGSHDRAIKHWNMTEMAYIETLFGHQSVINDLDCLQGDRVYSCGSDKSVRLWKIPEETQLIFNGLGSIDCLRMVNEQYCVTGNDEGSLMLWSNGRKKALFTQTDAHGAGNWIASLAVLPGTDLLASGSCDGTIRLWQIELEKRALIEVATIPVVGFVNSLTFAKNGRFLLAGIGQEHRLGRWSKIAGVKNGILLVALPDVLHSKY